MLSAESCAATKNKPSYFTRMSKSMPTCGSLRCRKWVCNCSGRSFSWPFITCRFEREYIPTTKRIQSQRCWSLLCASSATSCGVVSYTGKTESMLMIVPPPRPHPCSHIAWLQVINIMGSKKQPVEDIEWPPGLKQVFNLLLSCVFFFSGPFCCVTSHPATFHSHDSDGDGL